MCKCKQQQYTRKLKYKIKKKWIEGLSRVLLVVNETIDFVVGKF